MNSDAVSDLYPSHHQAASLAEGQQEESTIGGITLKERLRRCWWRIFARQVTFWSAAAMRIAGWIGRKPRARDGQGLEILLTGRSDSANWLQAHLAPLAASEQCSCIWMVSTYPIPSLPKVQPVYPPSWLQRIVGATLSRLLTFGWVAMRKRPHVVGGFHLVVNGVVAVIVGRLTGARSLYFCVGGPPEVIGGGAYSDDHAFARMKTGDAVVERQLLSIVSECSAVVTMGTRAVTFFRSRGIRTPLHVVSGGIDPERFRTTDISPSIDLILTGRLAPVKRMDVFLQAIRHVAERLPDVRAVIVGDGRLREQLQQMSRDLGIDANVTFAGRQDNVEEWLRSAKVFVLTSDSEGLSLSMMEAMMSGLPAVVSNVGDLGDLVEDGVNGYLVPRRSPELFADRLIGLLSDAPKLAAFSRAARTAAMRYATPSTTRHWDDILADL